jgi:hypothetical protein
MVSLTKHKVMNQKGKIEAYLINKKDGDKITEYIEYLEDSLELEKAVKEETGFRLWEDFVSEYRSKHESNL